LLIPEALVNPQKACNDFYVAGQLSKKSRFIEPVLKQAFMQKIGHRLHAGMDISDGLSKDLSRLCKESKGVGIQWHKRFSKKELCSGEEYELLLPFRQEIK
jgi:thiamine-monophosphate kinase